MSKIARGLALATLLAASVGLVEPTRVTGADLGALGSRAASRFAAQTQHVTITTPSTGLHEMPLVVGIRRGFFSAENLDVARVQMAPPVSVAAVIAGDGDYTLSVGSTVTAVVGAAAPLRVVGGLAVLPLQVLVTADPAIRDVADLRGRSVGTSTISDTTANLMRLAARAHGLEAQTDVSLQPLGESPNRLAALQSGQVSAVMLDLALAQQAQLAGGRILVAPTDLPPLPTSGVVVTETKLREQPQQVEAVLRAALRAIRYMQQNREDALGLFMEHMGLDRQAAELTYDLGMGAFAADGLISDRGLQLLIDAARDTTGQPSEVTPGQLADFTLVRRVAAQLGP
jgi:ABC-type nitrate/sulfonate/bicarbonate transport system substrate-binding protein